MDPAEKRLAVEVEDPVSSRPESVVSGRTIGELGAT